MSVIVKHSYILTAPATVDPNDPILLWDNRCRGATVTADSEDGNNLAENAIDGLTWDFWKPASLPATLEVEFSHAETFDAAGIVFSSEGPQGVTAKVEYWDGSQWQEAVDLSTPNRVILALFEEQTSTKVRLSLSGGTGIPRVADFTVGPALRFERRLYQGHIPDVLATRTEFAVNRSRNGQRLGATVVREGLENTIEIDNLSGDWVRANLVPAINSLRRTYPAYWAWRPAKYPNDLAFIWCDRDIRPPNTGPRDLMSVSIPYVGIGPETIDGPQ